VLILWLLSCNRLQQADNRILKVIHDPQRWLRLDGLGKHARPREVEVLQRDLILTVPAIHTSYDYLI